MFTSSLQPYQMLKKYEQMAHYHHFDMFYVSVCTGSDANSAFFSDFTDAFEWFFSAFFAIIADSSNHILFLLCLILSDNSMVAFSNLQTIRNTYKKHLKCIWIRFRNYFFKNRHR